LSILMRPVRNMVFLVLVGSTAVCLAAWPRAAWAGDDPATDEDKQWLAALQADREGDAGAALAAYDSFLESYPKSEMSTQALARISDLKGKVEAEQKELFNKIEAEQSPSARAELCAEYLERFPNGLHVEKVEAVKSDALAAAAQADADESAFSEIRASTDDTQTIRLCESYVGRFKNGVHIQEVWPILIAARGRVKEQRESIGKVHRMVGVGLMILGGASAAGGGVFAIVAKRKFDDLESSCKDEFHDHGCPPSERESAKEDIKKNALIADIGLGFGAAAIVGGILLYALAPSWKKQQRESDSGGATVTLVPMADGRGAYVGIGRSF
jgi:hypothetical protein